MGVLKQLDPMENARSGCDEIRIPSHRLRASDLIQSILLDEFFSYGHFVDRRTAQPHLNHCLEDEATAAVVEMRRLKGVVYGRLNLVGRPEKRVQNGTLRARRLGDGRVHYVRASVQRH